MKMQELTAPQTSRTRKGGGLSEEKQQNSEKKEEGESRQPSCPYRHHPGCAQSGYHSAFKRDLPEGKGSAVPPPGGAAG